MTKARSLRDFFPLKTFFPPLEAPTSLHLHKRPRNLLPGSYFVPIYTSEHCNICINIRKGLLLLAPIRHQPLGDKKTLTHRHHVRVEARYVFELESGLALANGSTDGRKERVQFDKITARVSRLCYGLDAEHVDAAAITQKVISGVYQGVTTVELDNLVCYNICNASGRVLLPC